MEILTQHCRMQTLHGSSDRLVDAEECFFFRCAHSFGLEKYLVPHFELFVFAFSAFSRLTSVALN